MLFGPPPTVGEGRHPFDVEDNGIKSQTLCVILRLLLSISLTVENLQGGQKRLKIILIVLFVTTQKSKMKKLEL